MKKKKRPHLKWALLATGGTVLMLTISVLGYQITQLPEAVFVAKTTVEGFSQAQPNAKFESFDELESALEVWSEARLVDPLNLDSERGSIASTLTSLGVSAEMPDLNQSSALKKIKTYLFGDTVKFTVSLSEELLNQTLTQSGIEQERKNALFFWDGKAVAIQPGQIAYTIEREPLATFLESSFSNPTLQSPFRLTVTSTEPEITDTELAAILPQAEEVSDKALTFQDELGNTWDLALKDHLDWIQPSGVQAWTLNQAAFISYAETTLAPEVEVEPAGVVISETAAQDGTSTYSFEGSARFGQKLDKLALFATVLEKILPELEVVPAPDAYQDPDASIKLPIEKIMPAVTVPDSLKAKGVTDLVGYGYSDFGGSPSNRIHNINTGIAQFNGVLVDQGAEFSFMGHLSPVDAAHGFLPELVIKGDETIPEYGGGLCQISSTMFRAALYSGLPITARRNHSYAVSYYARPFGYGLDATVYDPAPDFKFVNDTAGALLVQAYTEGSSAYYVFYGTNDARTVTMEGPYSYDYNSAGSETTYTDKLAPGERELKEYGHTGFTTDWYRTVTYAITEAPLDENGEPTVYVSPYAATASGVRENIHSVYEARPSKYWEGGTEEAPSL